MRRESHIVMLCCTDMDFFFDNGFVLNLHFKSLHNVHAVMDLVCKYLCSYLNKADICFDISIFTVNQELH